MRVFLAAKVGSGTVVMVDLDPADWYTDVDTGETVTQRPHIDAVRPDCTRVGDFISVPMTARGRDYFFCVDRDATSAPAGTLDLGDPTDAATLDVTPSGRERRLVEQYFGLPNNSLSGFTRRQIIKWCLNDRPRFAARFRGVVIDIIRDGD